MAPSSRAPRSLPISMGREAAIRVETRLRVLIEGVAAGGAVQRLDTDEKVGAMYAAFMNEHRVETFGMTPIKALVDEVAAAKDKKAIAALMGQTFFDFGSSTFDGGIDVDLKDPVHYTTYLTQAGLGLPDRDYYLKPGGNLPMACPRTAACTQSNGVVTHPSQSDPLRLSLKFVLFAYRRAGSP